MFDRILLAVDGSDHALHAARVAADLARAVEATELRIVIAYEPVPAYLGEPNLSNAIHARLIETQDALRATKDVIGEIPGEIHEELIEGPVADAIIDVATTRHSDVIVMGSRGLGRFVGALLGSNSQRVVSEAPCPVLIVR